MFVARDEKIELVGRENILLNILMRIESENRKKSPPILIGGWHVQCLFGMSIFDYPIKG